MFPHSCCKKCCNDLKFCVLISYVFWYRAAFLFLCLQHSDEGALSDFLLDDYADFQRIETAMKQMGISAADMEDLYQVVAGVLHLGNISFVDGGGSSGKYSRCLRLYL